MFANLILILHVCFILFVAAGWLLIAIGGFRRWQWVCNLKFRILHLAAIVIVVLESWLGVMCPLTEWEYMARLASGQPVPEGDFIAYWLQSVFFFDAPAWVFTLAYTLFGVLVALTWILVPPFSRFRQHLK